ncbi:MAG: hypothetical protein KJS87_08960 [Alphaproteobacteria bacterium]|nr:hypothetical protein [Alphaproteobacteria bacterium]
MSRFFPPSTNADYHGRPLAAWFLTLVSLGTIVPGGIHVFLPDGGAGVIAGIDLTQGGKTIIAVFAWAGATQMVWGLSMLVVSLAYRSLVPLFLFLILVERSIIAANQWILKSTGTGHQPPEAYVTLLALPLVALMLGLALARRPSAG